MVRRQTMRDWIEGDKVMNILEDMDVGIIPYAHARKYAQITIDHIRKQTENIPSARPKAGKWIVYEGGWKDLDYYPPKCKCNQCGYEEELYILNAKPTNFCPNCGSDNRERNDDE